MIQPARPFIAPFHRDPGSYYNMKNILRWIGCLLLLSGFAGATTINNFAFRTYTDQYGNLPYRLLIPTNYLASTKYPLVLNLHGSGERGSDNAIQVNAYT